MEDRPMSTAASPDPGLERDVVAWLREQLPADWVKALDAGDDEGLRMARDQVDPAGFLRRLGEAGYAMPTWPVEHGGLGLSADQAAVVQRCLDRYGAFQPSDFVGRTLAGPTLLQWGTEEQKRRFLPPLARSEERWCQLFSEPGAGSDLAGMATRATRDGDGWLVNGQKVWTSGAADADFGLLMARTDPDVPKHRGLTYFIADMRAPGVEVRPLRDMTGRAHFNEVFLTDVVIADDRRIGPVNDGWRVSITTLTNERTALSGLAMVGKGRVDVLIERARRSGAWEDRCVRDRLMRLYIDERALQMTNARTAAARASGRPPGSEGSVTKLFQSALIQRVARTAVELFGPGGVAWVSGDADMPVIVQTFHYSPAHTIAGGTSEVQRNIIGERVLGLPREQDVDRDIAWKDVARTVAG
jgi:alkylation response protein AidB-like acyl-CoA dehydrogenase